MNGKRIGKRIMWIFGGVIFGAGIALVFGFIVRALWNWLMPSIFGLGEITYWQAWGLVLLSHILFKGSRDNGQVKTMAEKADGNPVLIAADDEACPKHHGLKLFDKKLA